MDGYCILPYTCKCCTVLKQFDGLNFDGLAGKSKTSKFYPGQNFPLYGIVMIYCHTYIAMLVGLML